MKLFSLKNIPLTIVISFNLLTLFVFYTAPIQWKTDNLTIFLFYSLLCQAMIIIGYKAGYRKKIKKWGSNLVLYTLSAAQLNFIMLFYALTFLIKYAYLLRFSFLDIPGMISFLLIGIADQNIGYSLSLDASRPYTISWSVYFITAIINQVFFLIGFIKWRDMNRYLKIIFLVFLSVDLFYWMGRGTNFGVISIVTTFLFAVMYKLQSTKLNFSKILLLSFLILLLLIGSISFFSTTMNNRRGNTDLDYQQFNLGRSTVNENAVAFSVLPKSVHDTYMYVVSYLSQGYYHTCLAFDLNFKSTYLLGNNPALIDFAKIFSIDVWEGTYMYRLKQKGVDPLVNWHSAYTWYASDISFFGVPFLLFGLGYFLGTSWSLILKRQDFLSKIVFIVLGNMLLYLFANNTYLSSVFYSFIAIMPIWLITRYKRYKL